MNIKKIARNTWKAFVSCWAGFMSQTNSPGKLQKPSSVQEAIRYRKRAKDAEAKLKAVTGALADLLANPLISAYYTSHKDMDMAFAEEVPSYKDDCEKITASFDKCIEALKKAN